MAQERYDASGTVRMIRTFIAAYDARDASDRQIATRIRERLHSELYRRERELYSQWIDLGGES